MADEYVYMEKATWTGICDNIRTKAGTTSTMTASEAETAISGISTGSAEDRLNGRLDGSAEGWVTTSAMEIVPYAMYKCAGITGVTAGNATTIGLGAFYGCDALTTAIIPSAKTLDGYTFTGTKLASISLPACTTINVRDFYNCTSLTSVSAPVFENNSTSSKPQPESSTTDIGSQFEYCTALTDISMDALKYGSSHMFRNCTALKSVSFPALLSPGDSMFDGCTALTSVNLPKMASGAWALFSGCSSLETIELPALDDTTYGYDFMAKCKNLAKVLLPVCTTIRGSYLFAACANLAAVCIGTNLATVCSLSVPDAFKKSSIEGSKGDSFSYGPVSGNFAVDGYIYVPDALVDAYKTATNWSVYADRIKGISTLTS